MAISWISISTKSSLQNTNLVLSFSTFKCKRIKFHCLDTQQLYIQCPGEISIPLTVMETLLAQINFSHVSQTN